jgi:hypothetical protein
MPKKRICSCFLYAPDGGIELLTKTKNQFKKAKYHVPTATNIIKVICIQKPSMENLVRTLSPFGLYPYENVDDVVARSVLNRIEEEKEEDKEDKRGQEVMQQEEEDMIELRESDLSTEKANIDNNKNYIDKDDDDNDDIEENFLNPKTPRVALIV